MRETQILCCKMGVKQTRSGGMKFHLCLNEENPGLCCSSRGVKFHLCDDGHRHFNSEIGSQSLMNVVAKKALIQRNIGMEIGT